MPSNKRIGVILDLDDTLVGTSVAYYKAVLEAMTYTTRIISPYMIEPKVMLDTYYTTSHEIHKKKREGITKGLYPVSGVKEIPATDFPAQLVEAFTIWCLKAGYRPTVDDLKKISSIGMSVVTHKYELLPNARALLHMLERKSNTRTFLITRGHHDLQKPKISRREFESFERIIIMPFTGSKLDEFKKLQLEYDNITNWYVVGDDINVDINPALACRIRAILVTKAASHIAKGEVLNIGNSLDYFTEVYDLAETMQLFRRMYAEDHEMDRLASAV